MADVAETYTARPLGCAFSRGVVQCGNADLNCTLSATGIAHSGVADPEVVAARPPTGQAGGRGGVAVCGAGRRGAGGPAPGAATCGSCCPGMLTMWQWRRTRSIGHRP